MNRRTCLTCKHWRRHADQMVGSCVVAEFPDPNRFRLQHEDCTEGRYQWGEDRPAARITHSSETPLVNGAGGLILKRVCDYYAAPFGRSDR